MTAEQLRNIALDNADHYDDLALDAYVAADTEFYPEPRAQMIANAAYYELRADFYRAQAAQYDRPLNWAAIPERIAPAELALFAQHAAEDV